MGGYMSLIEQFAIQLYSVRDVMENDYAGTLKKLAQMGYTGVEFAGYGGLSAQEMKDILSSNNLKPVGSHIGIKQLIENLDEEIAFHKILGTEYFICPYYEMKSKDDVLTLLKTLKPVAAKIKDEGFKLAYHNHAHEFVSSDGDYLLDILFQNLPEIDMELDIYWVVYAGVEPFGYMEKHKDRLKLLHIKQIDNEKHNVDLDKGILDFKKLISESKTLGTEHFIIEQEEFEISSMTSIKNDIEFLKKL
jgi:sugar phosphate isomerase/epimerase